MSKFKTYPFKDKDVDSIAEALVELPEMMNAFRRFMNGMLVSPDVDRIIIPPDCAGALFPFDSSGGGSSSMFWATSAEANKISVTAGVAVIGLNEHAIAEETDFSVANDKWLVLRADLRDPSLAPTYQEVDNPYPAANETYYKYWKIAQFDGSNFQRAWKGGLLEVDFT